MTTWAGNEEAMSKDEKKGLYEFIETGCVTCHTARHLEVIWFQKFGVYGNYWEATGSEHIDDGRFKFTGNEVEKYMFKVPTLRTWQKRSLISMTGLLRTFRKSSRSWVSFSLIKT